jgi:rhodanese-related sulfurtransferase
VTGGSAVPACRDVRPDEAGRLVAAGGVRVLDVRTPAEYDLRGHVPGAVLLPLELIASAPATLAPDIGPILVCCEDGVRSREAAAFLARAGFEEVLVLVGGMSRWPGGRAHGPGLVCGPSSWLLQNADLLPPQGQALDVACGFGRHALYLAANGLEVTAIDRDAGRIERLRAAAARLGLPVDARVVDLEAGAFDLGADRYALVLVIHYLHRPLFPAIGAALAPGGLLLYETFTEAQASRGRPSSPEHLLKAGELSRLVAPLEVLRGREGESEGRMVASVAARRPGENVILRALQS